MKLKAALVFGLVFSLVSPSAQAAQRVMREHGDGSAVGDACPVSGSCFDFTSSADGTPIDNGHFNGMVRISGDTFQNPEGQVCLWGRGHGVFRKGSTNRIRIEFEGPWCIYEDNPGKGQGRLKAYYKVTGGHGNFAGADGRGGINMTFAYADEAPFKYRSDGSLST
jgi:hypothetical protein